MEEIFEKNLLTVSPVLAEKIGLNEAIVLQQVHYWLKIAEKKDLDHHFYDNQWWIYNTYSEWKKQFPFWSEITIKRTFLRLEEMKILISANFNKMKCDHTKWYTIDYEMLENAVNNDSINLILSNVSNCYDRTYQNDTSNTRDYTFTSAHKTNTNEPSPGNPERDLEFESKIRERVRTSCRNVGVDDYRKEDIINDVIFFYRYYRKKKKEQHPMLKQETFDRVVYKIITNESMPDLSEPNIWEISAYEYFERDMPKSDYHLPHFVTDGVQKNNNYLMM